MGSKFFMLFGVFLSIASFILTIVGASFNKWLSLVSAIVFCIGVVMIVIWRLKSYIWRCEECNEEFELSIRENMFNVNLGLDYKKLYCPNCKTKTYCEGIRRRSS